MEIVDLSKRYTFERILGQGGMGVVHLAFDKRLGRCVAIKRMLAHFAASGTAKKRFLTEAKSIARVHHPNIVLVFDVGRDAEGLFLAMEFVEGGSLLERCRDGVKIPLDEAVDIICQLCDGLSKAHELGIIHRDIKPANVMLTPDGRPKLTDFGLARQELADASISQSGQVLGTLEFMPPEQQRDARDVDPRSDLWSLAATLYQMVTGRRPRVINLGDVDPKLQPILSKALQDAREDRYQTAREFHDALRSSLQSPVPAASTPVELGSGQCPDCRTVNEPHRKFCRECAAPLRIACLKCQVEIPVWDKVCPECGAIQADLLAARQRELAALRTEAEELLGFYAFDRATQCVREMTAEQDRRLQPFKKWAEAFLPKITEEESFAEEKARTLFAEARTHRKAFDYGSAIAALGRVPKPLMTSEMSSFLQRLVAEKDESEKLIAEIRQRVKARQLDDLLPLVSRALELRGDRTDLPRLMKQLQEREQQRIEQQRIEKQRVEQRLEEERDQCYAKAERLLEQGKAKEALGSPQKIIYPVSGWMTRL
ncbi:MAG: protein kinase, partial [Pirellulaceae bacterium]|nr:protein kinase [Pirellulaceae bacterium]